MPEIHARATQPTAAPKKTYEHKHPNGEVYLATCKACRADDAARSAPDFINVDDKALEYTTFLIPEPEYDNQVCREYLKLKYPDAQWIGSSLDLSKLNGWAPNEQIVVVRRDTWPNDPEPGFVRAKDIEEKWIWQKVPPKTFVKDVVESAPINVRDALVLSRGDRFTKSTVDHMGLVRRLAELMPNPYRPDMPRDKNDVLLRFVHS